MPLFSHYGDVPDISHQISYPALVFSIITPLFVIARFISRHIFTKNIGPDDWVILASMVTGESLSIMWIIICIWAFGKHHWDVPEHIMGKSLKLYFFAQILYKINIGLTKISILLLYIKIFLYDWFIITCWVCAGIVVAFTTGTVITSIFQCSPVNSAFEGARGSCIDLTAFWYVNAGFNIASDIVIIILPILVISKLMLPKKTKIAVCGVFALGSFVCITSILRVKTLDVATSSRDTPWHTVPCIMWTIIESNLGIICACLPTFRQLLAAFCPRIFGRFGKTDPSVEQSYNRSLRRRGGTPGLDSTDSYPARGLMEMSSMEAGKLGDFFRAGRHSNGRISDGVDDAGNGRITKTTQVVVQYGSSEDSGSKDMDLEPTISGSCI